MMKPISWWTLPGFLGRKILLQCNTDKDADYTRNIARPIGRLLTGCGISKESWYTLQNGKIYKRHQYTLQYNDFCCRDHGYDWASKRVAVIGNGSSGIQCVAAMQPKVKQLVNFVRNPTWVSVNFCAEKTHDGSNFKYTEEQKQEFADDSEAHFKYRRELEARQVMEPKICSILSILTLWTF